MTVDQLERDLLCIQPDPGCSGNTEDCPNNLLQACNTLEGPTLQLSFNQLTTASLRESHGTVESRLAGAMLVPSGVVAICDDLLFNRVILSRMMHQV